MTTEKMALSPSEVSAQLGLSINNVYTCIHAGKIPHIRLGKRILIPRQALERLLNGESDHYENLPVVTKPR